MCRKLILLSQSFVAHSNVKRSSHVFLFAQLIVLFCKKTETLQLH